MVKERLGTLMEWLRPFGIGLIVFLAHLLEDDATAQFHILGPFVVMLMCGTVAFEAMVLGETASAKIGYAPDRAYQIQSGLANAAIAVTALLVHVLNWGRFADATIVTAMLSFFLFSAGNHLLSAIRGGNFKPVNLLRPVLALVLMGFLLPPMLGALAP
ncbi:MAG: hypothetical protein HY901_00475 [Deltaproteobacteria bacterium]|nr:hypothetical protein [Deltaproteobacteria bacterium]